MKYSIAIDRCPEHNYYAVSINKTWPDGGGIGQRLTPSKCCGSWKKFKEWSVTKDDLVAIANDMLAFAKETT